jgi:hypothetical protein
MSIGQIIVLATIVGAFVVFAAVLGWGDYRAQQTVRRIRNRKDAALAAAAHGAATAQARWPQPSYDRLQRVA